jgi:hypothetical protein
VKILVGWWSIDTGELVDIPGFDAVPNPERWLQAIVDVPEHEVRAKFDAPGQ